MKLKCIQIKLTFKVRHDIPPKYKYTCTEQQIMSFLTYCVVLLVKEWFCVYMINIQGTAIVHV